jgi:hypothetical protein
MVIGGFEGDAERRGVEHRDNGKRQPRLERFSAQGRHRLSPTTATTGGRTGVTLRQ